MSYLCKPQGNVVVKSFSNEMAGGAELVGIVELADDWWLEVAVELVVGGGGIEGVE